MSMVLWYDEDHPIPRSRSLRTRDSASFDGNGGDFLTLWLVPRVGWQSESDAVLERLIGMTVEDGHLSWMLLPIDGFRV